MGMIGVYPFSQATEQLLASKQIKDSKQRLFIMRQTYHLQIVGVKPFVKLQNDT